MQVTIQKKYLILIEVSQDVYRFFVLIISFVFDFVEEKISKTFNFIRALFGFNIYRLRLVQTKTKTNFNDNFTKNRNQDFLIYSNLLAPPKKSLNNL